MLTKWNVLLRLLTALLITYFLWLIGMAVPFKWYFGLIAVVAVVPLLMADSGVSSTKQAVVLTGFVVLFFLARLMANFPLATETAKTYQTQTDAEAGSAMCVGAGSYSAIIADLSLQDSQVSADLEIKLAELRLPQKEDGSPYTPSESLSRKLSADAARVDAVNEHQRIKREIEDAKDKQKKNCPGVAARMDELPKIWGFNILWYIFGLPALLALLLLLFRYAGPKEFPKVPNSLVKALFVIGVIALIWVMFGSRITEAFNNPTGKSQNGGSRSVTLAVVGSVPVPTGSTPAARNQPVASAYQPLSKGETTIEIEDGQAVVNLTSEFWQSGLQVASREGEFLIPAGSRVKFSAAGKVSNDSTQTYSGPNGILEYSLGSMSEGSQWRLVSQHPISETVSEDTVVALRVRGNYTGGAIRVVLTVD
jgi:hypothetical protein